MAGRKIRTRKKILRLKTKKPITPEAKNIGIFIVATARLQKEGKLEKFEKIKLDFSIGKIGWIQEKQRAAALTFIAAKMAGIKVNEKNAEFFKSRLTKEDMASLKKLIKLYS